MSSQATIITLVTLAFVSNKGRGEGDISCATASLHILSCWERAPESLESVAARLPARVDGHSLQDIIAAAAAMCLPLRARPVICADDLPKGAFIAHLAPPEGETIGHFLAIRALERSARQLQIVEPHRYPRLVERAALIEPPFRVDWVLIHSPWSGTLRAVGTLFTSAAVLLFTIGLLVMARAGRQRSIVAVGSREMNDRGAGSAASAAFDAMRGPV